MRCIPWGDPPTDYYEVQAKLISEFRAGVNLANNFLYCPDKQSEIQLNDLEEYKEYDPDANQIWLLYQRQASLLPVYHGLRTNLVTPNGRAKALKHLGSLPPRYQIGPKLTPKRHYEALLMLHAEVVTGGLYIDADVSCRDPWADVALCAYWYDCRLRAAADELGGATELRIIATERDVPLQKELKSLGYFCYEIDREAGEYCFSKILELRSRKNALDSRRNRLKGFLK